MNFVYTFLILACVIWSINGETYGATLTGSKADFCYIHPSCEPSTWRGLCHTGLEQSPIDIDYGQVEFFPEKSPFYFSQNYFQPTRFYAINNGYTFHVQLDPKDPTSNVYLENKHLDSTYTFAQLHFHWGTTNQTGSEHFIQGKSYPLEVHLVHYKSKYGSMLNAISQLDREALVVIGILFKMSPTDNPALEPIIKAVSEPSMFHPGNLILMDFPLVLTDFFPNRTDYIRYRGSLTTPLCSEKVLWMVISQTADVSLKQMHTFMNLLDDHDDTLETHRPIQPLNNRALHFYKSELREIQGPLLDPPKTDKPQSTPKVRSLIKALQFLATGTNYVDWDFL